MRTGRETVTASTSSTMAACLHLRLTLVNLESEVYKFSHPMHGFTISELKRPGLLRRLVGNKLPENAFVEIENLLATKNVHDLSAAEVIDVLSRYEIPRDEAMPALATLYEKALWHALHDVRLSPAEREDLKHLRYALDLESKTADEVEATILRAVYRDELKKALDDELLSEAETQKLEQIAANVALPEAVKADIYKEEVLAIIQEAFKRAIEDRRLTAQEEQRLAHMSENLGVKISHDAESQRVVERFKLLARIEAGELPVIHPSVLLQRGEVCHAEFSCRLHEMRTVTKRINYHGPTGRIRIMKGLSWRYGSVNVSRVTSEELRQLDLGVLYITNKRLLFNGASKSINTPLKKIIHFTVFKDGIQVEKETGRDQFYLGGNDLELISEVLEAALRTAR